MTVSRIFLLTLGAACIAIGALGVVMPILPTTPFLLLAALCFARSSPRLHRWLLGHHLFGPLIADWKDHGAIAPTTKAVALATMAAALGASVGLGLAPMVIAMQALVLTGAAVFILTRPNAHRS